MRIDRFKFRDVWQDVKDAAMNTISKDAGKYPSDSWKKKILLCEHSPIRLIKVFWRWINLKYWVSVHFVRHKFGVDHWVSTQRTDRTGVDRNELPQGSLVKHSCEANAQAIINMSRKRLCPGCASPETLEAWTAVKNEIEKIDSVLASVMVRECIYRGFCPEFYSCGYVETEEYQKELAEYRNTDI